MSTYTLSALFQPAPIQWGLRGDPYLWQEMSEVLAPLPLPPSGAQLSAILDDTFERLVGLSPDSTESSVFVERHSHGGMSSGGISLVFWREKGLPLLLTRYHAALDNCDARQ